jgi:hypothetical protein
MKSSSAIASSSAIRRIRQPLNHILTPRHTDNGHTRDLPNSPLQIPIVGRHQINAMLHNAIDETVIRIRSLVVALQSLPALIPRYPESDAVFGPEFLELGHDAGCDYGRGFGVEAVHEGALEVEFRVHGV